MGNALQITRSHFSNGGCFLLCTFRGWEEFDIFILAKFAIIFVRRHFRLTYMLALQLYVFLFRYSQQQQQQQQQQQKGKQKVHNTTL